MPVCTAILKILFMKIFINILHGVLGFKKSTAEYGFFDDGIQVSSTKSHLKKG